MSNNGFMGWIQKNPGTAFAIFLVFAAIVTVIVMVTRGSAPSAGPGAASDLPVLEVSGTKVVKSTKTSGYAMKYEYLGEHLGDNVNFTITINTKSGFEQNGITKLNVFRYKPDATESSGKKLLDTMPISGITNYGRYEVTFLGGALEEDAVPSTGGKQIFEIVGLLSDDTPYYPPDETGTYGKVLATTEGSEREPEIDVKDLNYVLTDDMSVPFEWTVSGASTLTVEKSEAFKSKYTLSILPGKSVLMVPGTAPDTYTFKYMDGATETPFTVDGITEFKLDQPDENKQVYLFYTTTGIVTREGGVITGPLKIKDPKMMTGPEFEMAKVSVTESIDEKWTEVGKYPGTRRFLNANSAPFDYNGDGTVSSNMLHGGDRNMCYEGCSKNPDCYSFSYDTDGIDQSCYFKGPNFAADENIFGAQGGFVSYADRSKYQYFGNEGASGSSDPAYSGQSNIPVRYVRFHKLDITDPSSKPIDIHEVLIYDSNGIKITPAGITASDSYGPTFPVTNMIDDKYSGMGSTLNPETNDTSQFPWVVIDLGKVWNVSKLIFYNRYQYYSRAAGMQVLFADGDGKVVEITPKIESIADSFTKKIKHEYSVATKKWVVTEPTDSGIRTSVGM